MNDSARLAHMPTPAPHFQRSPFKPLLYCIPALRASCLPLELSRILSHISSTAPTGITHKRRGYKLWYELQGGRERWNPAPCTKPRTPLQAKMGALHNDDSAPKPRPPHFEDPAENQFHRGRSLDGLLPRPCRNRISRTSHVHAVVAKAPPALSQAAYTFATAEGDFQ